jgi:hypothetical protein
MNGSKNQVMTCGACAVMMNEDGQTTTSIDALVSGVKHIASRFSRNGSTRRSAVATRI